MPGITLIRMVRWLQIHGLEIDMQKLDDFGVAREMHLTHIIGTNQAGQLTGTFYSHVVIEHFNLNIGAGNVVVAMSNGVNN